MSDLKRVTVNLSSDLVAEVDAYATKMHVSRTAAMAFLLSSSLNGIELMSAVKEQQATTISSKKTSQKKKA